MLKGTPAPLKKLGRVQTINADTGEVIETKENAFTLQEAPEGTCVECAVDHPHDQPHNQQSLHYQMHFRATHGRWPTWTDAMAHCTPEMRKKWRKDLIFMMRKHGLPVPADLLAEKSQGMEVKRA